MQEEPSGMKGKMRSRHNTGKTLSLLTVNVPWLLQFENKKATRRCSPGKPQAVFSGSLLGRGEPDPLRAAGLGARTGMKLPLFQECAGLAMLSPANLPPGVRGWALFIRFCMGAS